jgi:4-hydroxybenzoate polyprenyltransferase
MSIADPAAPASIDGAGNSPAPAVAAGPVRLFFRLLRCQQWVKNAFIFGPLVFVGRLGDAPSVLTALLAFLSFSLVASALYIFNDWTDRFEDRLHPLKCRRPIAAGLVSGRRAFATAVPVLLAGIAIPLAARAFGVLLLETAYVVLNLAYSLRLKRTVLVDVFAISAGFVIRVWVGAVALHVAASHWLILCIFFLALFLGFSKREAELRLPDGNAAGHRSVLRDYSSDLIAQLNLVVLSATLLCYALYTVAPETVAKFGTDRLVYSVPLVAYGLMRYLFLIRARAQGGSPTDLLLRDRPLQTCIVLWLTYCVAILYFFH